MAGKDNKIDLIHQLYQEVLGETEEEEKDIRYIRSTGTLYGNPERFEKEQKERKQKVEEKDDPWSKLDLKPSDLR